MRLYSFKLLAEWTWQGCWLVARGYLKLISRDLVTNWNLQDLATEILRVYTGSTTGILNEVLPPKPSSIYNLKILQKITYENCTF